MSAAGWELQKAVYAALLAHAPLSAVLGGAGRVHDDVPAGAALPYVAFGPTSSRDWSTGTETGSEHTLTLHAWSRAGGRREAHFILEAVRAALDGAALTVTGHRLVSLRHQTTDIARQADGETWRGVLRLVALIEPAA